MDITLHIFSYMLEELPWHLLLQYLQEIAYYKLRTKRLLLSAIAFTNFIAAEIVLLVDTTWPTMYDLGDMPLFEVGHLLTFATLGLLALGVFRND